MSTLPILMVGAPGPTDWISLLELYINQSKRCILVFVSSHQGSTPRETGTWLVVNESHIMGTLGGGEIERSAIATARDILEGRQAFERCNQNFHLGPDLGQCCGGVMAMLFEPIDERAFEWLNKAQSIISHGKPGYIVFPISELGSLPKVFEGIIPENLAHFGQVHVQQLNDQRPLIALYGAGHVGRAVAAISIYLPIRLLVVDERKDELEKVPLSSNVKTAFRENPVFHAKEIFDTNAVIIMTHSHGLDYRLCQVLIENHDLSYIGLIGSKTKAVRFRHALKKEGKTLKQISRIVCPIGKDGPDGKEPGIIALSVLSELLVELQGEKISNKEKILRA